MQPPDRAMECYLIHFGTANVVLLMTRMESSVFRAIAESISICSNKRGWALHIVTAADAENAKALAESWHAVAVIEAALEFRHVQH